jgi:DNA-binding NtrC family response regulator
MGARTSRPRAKLSRRSAAENARGFDDLSSIGHIVVVLPKVLSFPSLPSASSQAAPPPPPGAPPEPGPGSGPREPPSGPSPASGEMAHPPPDAVTVLVVDDERSNIESLEKIFLREGMRVLSASDAKKALELVRTHRVHVVLTDLMMPGTTGLELLRAIKQVAPDVEVVLMTAYGSVEVAVSAMRDGAYDFVEKPLKRVSIVKSVRKAAEKQKLVAENQSLKDEIKRLAHREIIGSSSSLRRVMDVATQAAPSQATVLVLGESGTGKELLARYIHERSARARGPFVAVNCAAIAETILESELFGHERGAFTGAMGKKEGRFARAAGGTLFLDEIGELSPSVQVKLLRVLQEGEYEPVGGHTTKADVRIVAATNRDLVAEVAAGRFREDLYYRLDVIAITAPPLRVRREDIPLLVDHFLGLYCAKNGRPRLHPTRAVLDRLMDYGWPGNVRELENVVERAVVLSRSDALAETDLPPHIAAAPPRAKTELTFDIGTPLEEIELRVIRETLRHTKGDKSVAAQLLGISTRTIYRKLDGVPDELPTAEATG